MIRGDGGVDYWLTEHINIPHEDGAEDTTPIVTGLPWATDSSASFIDREHVTVSALRDTILSRTVHSSITVIHGKSGSGKSELAKQYVRQAHAMGWYKAIVWIDGSSDLDCSLSISYVSRALGPQIPWRGHVPPHHTIHTPHPSNYLIVYDNAPNHSIASEPTLREPPFTHIIVTSATEPGLTTHCKRFKVTDWKPEDVESLFRTAFGDPIPVLAENQFSNVFKNLKMCPLTTRLAAYYLRESKERLQHQIASYEGMAKELKSKKVSERDVSLAAIVVTSLQQCSAESLRLLCFLAFMHSTPVPLWAMTPDPRFSDVILRRIFSNKKHLLDTIEPLSRYGLVYHNSDIGGDESISVHPRIQRVVRDLMELDLLHEISRSEIPERSVFWIQLATEFVILNYPGRELASVILYNIHDALTPHAMKCFQYSEEYGIASEMLSLLMSVVATYVCRIEPWTGDCLGRRSQKMLEKIHGTVDFRSAMSLTTLAWILRWGPQATSNFTKHVERATKVLDLCTQKFGPGHLALLPAVYNCARFYAGTHGELFYLRVGNEILERHYGKRCGATRFGHLALERTHCRVGWSVAGIRGMQQIIEEAAYPIDKIPPDIVECLVSIAIETKKCAGTLPAMDIFKSDGIDARKRILEIEQVAGDSKSVAAKASLQDLGETLAQKNRWAEAIEYYKQLAEIEAEDPDNTEWSLELTLDRLIDCHVGLPDYPGAMKSAEQKLALLEKKHGVDSAKCVDATNRIGRLYRRLEKTTEAITAYEHVLPHDDAAARENPGPFMVAYGWLASLNWKRGKLEEALRLVEKAITIGERYPNQVVDKTSLTRSYITAGELLVSVGRFHDARAWFPRASAYLPHPPPPHPLAHLQMQMNPPPPPQGIPPHLIIAPQPVPQPPPRSPYSPIQIRSMEGLANIKFLEGKVFDAVNDYRLILSIVKTLGPNPGLLTAYSPHQGLGIVYHHLGAYAQAMHEFKRVFELIADQRVLWSGQAEAHSEFYARFGNLYLDLGKFEQALKYKIMGFETIQAAIDPSPCAEPRSLADIGGVYMKMGKLEQARDYFQRALDKAMSVTGPEGMETVCIIESMASLQDVCGEYDLALENYEKALTVRKTYFGDDHLYTTRTRITMAQLLNKQGRFEDALKMCHHALRIMFGVYNDPTHLFMSHGLEVLARILRRLRRYDAAVNLLRRIFDVRSRRSPQPVGSHKDIDTLYPLITLAGTYAVQGKYEKGIAYARRALQLAEKVYGDGHLWTGRPEYYLGIILKMAGQDEEADVHLTRSKELLIEKFGTADHPWLRNRQMDIDWFLTGKYRTEEIPEIDFESNPDGKFPGLLTNAEV